MNAVLDEKCFNDFLKLIYELTGITIAKNRNSMVEGRLRKRMTTLAINNYEEYLSLVKNDPQERVKFIDLITTNETYFFRTPRIWDYIEKTVLPQWRKQYPVSGTFNAWSAAASSGDEAHTLGVIFQAFKEKNSGFAYRVTGTDISAEMIALCRAGLYSGKSIEFFKKNRLDYFNKYMVRAGTEQYKAVDVIRNSIQFVQHNLFKKFQAKEKFDLILIRNVLIYFTPADQEKVLGLLSPLLKPHGVLIIGESESLSHIKTPFKHVEPLIYQLDATGKTTERVA